jgi:hypothetical protein
MLPKDLLDAVQPAPAGPLLGIALGTPTTALKGHAPRWFERDEPDPSGTYRSTCLSTGFDVSAHPAFEGAVATVSFSLDQVQSTQFSFDLAEPDDLETAYTELCVLFDANHGVGKRSRKGKRLLGAWEVKGALPGALTLQAWPMSMGDDGVMYRVEINLGLAEGATLKPLATAGVTWLDVGALARALATPEWPQAHCLGVFNTFFAYDSPYQAAQTAPQAAQDLVAIHEAAFAAAQDLRPLLEALVHAYDWADARNGYAESGPAQYAYWRAWHFSFNNGVQPTPPQGVFFPFNLKDALALLGCLDVPVGERAAWVWKIVAAVQFDDAAACQAVEARLLAQKQAGKPHLTELYLDATPTLDERVLSLMTSTLDDAGKAAWVAGTSRGPDAMPALARLLARAWGQPEPAFDRAQAMGDWDALRASQWAVFLRTVRAHDAALFEACFETAMDRLSLYGPQAQRLCALLSPDQASVQVDGETTWAAFQLGPFVVTRTAKGSGRGRLSAKRHKTAKAAAADFARKVAAH